MNFDDSFDQTRLDQLAEQYLNNSSVTGRIPFYSDPEDDYVGLATWQLDKDEYYDSVKDSGFKFHMMELLHNLLAYRVQHGQPNARQGVVHINGDKLTIDWLPKQQVDEMRNGRISI